MKQIIAYILISPIIFMLSWIVFEKIMKKLKQDIHDWAYIAVPASIVLAGLSLIILFI